MSDFSGKQNAAAGPIAYGIMLIPTAIGTYLHFNLAPFYVLALGRSFEGAALPLATQWALKASPVWLILPWVIFLFVIASWRFRPLRHPVSIASLGSLLALFYLLSGIALALPLITLYDQIGESVAK
jgi:hypothetical protein